MSLLALVRQQIAILGVPADECDDERADGNDLAAVRAQQIERAAHDGGTETAPFELGRHFGVQQRDYAGRPAVRDERSAALELELIAVAPRVVSYGS